MGAGQSKLGCLGHDVNSDEEQQNIVKGEVANHETLPPNKKARSILGIENGDHDNDDAPVRIKSTGGLDFRDDPDMEEDGQQFVSKEKDVKQGNVFGVFGSKHEGNDNLKEKAEEYIRHLEPGREEADESNMIQDHMDEVDTDMKVSKPESKAKFPFSFSKWKSGDKEKENGKDDQTEDTKTTGKVQDFFKKVLPKETTENTYEGDGEENDEMLQKEEKTDETEKENDIGSQKSTFSDFVKGIFPNKSKSKDDMEETNETEEVNGTETEETVDKKSKFPDFFKGMFPKKKKVPTATLR